MANYLQHSGGPKIRPRDDKNTELIANFASLLTDTEIFVKLLIL